MNAVYTHKGTAPLSPRRRAMALTGLPWPLLGANIGFHERRGPSATRDPRVADIPFIPTTSLPWGPLIPTAPQPPLPASTNDGAPRHPRTVGPLHPHVA